MAGINSAQVYLPTPDQSSTTGAINVAPTSTAAPTDARTALGSGWTSGGYVGEDGLAMSLNRSTTPIKDWSQATVRNAVTDFDGKLTVPFMQFDEFAAQAAFGSSNVTKTAATASAGEQLKVSIGAELPPIQSWCFNMKDGNRRIRVYVPQGQVTEIGDVSFVPGEAHQYPCTISCYDDGTGHSIYVFYDDGAVVSQ